MIEAQFRPIQNWPGKMRRPDQRRRSTFKAKYAATLDLLEREIGHLGGKDIVIQAGFELREIRNDGWPRSSARPAHPAVIVSFHSAKKKAPLSFPCDTFDFWEDNLRAIALSLEALRQVDRYGVTQNAEQYTGFAQLSAPPDDAVMTEIEAALFLALNAPSGYPKDLIIGSKAVARKAYLDVAARVHPDNAKTGNHELFVQLQRAKTALQI